MITLTDDHRDALSEMINISFGRSMASLAELLGVFIHISVPQVSVIEADKIIEFLEESFDASEEISLIQQVFRGDFFGEAALALSADSCTNLVSMLTEEIGFAPQMETDKLELEALLEVGNIVIGACLGRFAELLGTVLTFDPPEIFWDRLSADRIRDRITARGDEVLRIHAKFDLKDRKAEGYLFVFLSHQCMAWLFSETDKFMAELF
ncbi:MAG: chemotaxis protein CheC [Desulfobacterales bacterium]|nr:chemotaxis protein CheC [Desulfobacterales bacterium]